MTPSELRAAAKRALSAGSPANAVELLEQAVRMEPSSPKLLLALSYAHGAARQPDKAMSAALRAISLARDDPSGYAALAWLMHTRHLPDRALAAFRQAVALGPVSPELAAASRSWAQAVADWRFSVDDAAAPHPWSALSENSSPRELQSIAQAASRAIARTANPLPRRASTGRARIRLGYLSAFFGRHPVTRAAVDLFARHNRDRFEVFGYLRNPDPIKEDPIWDRLHRGFDHFIDLSSLSYDEAARRIYEDEVDIMIDLDGLTHDASFSVLARRPARVQVHFIGFAGTTGAAFIDYLIADPVTAPFSAQTWYDEKLVHLPHCYQPNDPARPDVPAPPPRRDYGLPENGFVFCCFNQIYKIRPAIFDIWMRLLRSVPGSVLWLKSEDEVAIKHLRDEAAERGCAPDRLVFAAHADSYRAHLARHGNADLFLDTQPFTAQTTASDALWAGLPILTHLGDTFTSRVAASMLHAVGLPELVALDLGAYESMAFELATDSGRMQALRARLAANRLTSPLFDAARYARDIDDAYEHIAWRDRAGLPPEAFAVERIARKTLYKNNPQ